MAWKVMLASDSDQASPSFLTGRATSISSQNYGLTHTALPATMIRNINNINTTAGAGEMAQPLRVDRPLFRGWEYSYPHP